MTPTSREERTLRRSGWSDGTLQGVTGVGPPVVSPFRTRKSPVTFQRGAGMEPEPWALGR